MIIWSRVDDRHWLGVAERGDYHVMHSGCQHKQPYHVVFVPNDMLALPQELGARSTEANARYCASLHCRMASPASYADTIQDI